MPHETPIPIGVMQKFVAIAMHYLLKTGQAYPLSDQALLRRGDVPGVECRQAPSRLARQQGDRRAGASEGSLLDPHLV